MPGQNWAWVVLAKLRVVHFCRQRGTSLEEYCGSLGVSCHWGDRQCYGVRGCGAIDRRAAVMGGGADSPNDVGTTWDSWYEVVSWFTSRTTRNVVSRILHLSPVVSCHLRAIVDATGYAAVVYDRPGCAVAGGADSPRCPWGLPVNWKNPAGTGFHCPIWKPFAGRRYKRLEES